jgi:protocatechuate 3,4-dioxygenase beta subunit
MAAPHVAGAVALVWSAAPSLVRDIAETRRLLDESAVDTNSTQCGGTSDDNNVWGEGKLDTLALLREAPIGPSGTVEGIVTDRGTGEPVAGARVTIATRNPRNLITDAAGRYSARLATGTYEVTVVSFGYLASIGTVQIARDSTTRRNVALVSAPSHALSGRVLDPAGASVAGARVSIKDTPIPGVLTDANGGYRFASVPDGMYEIEAEAGRCTDVQRQSVTIDADRVLNLRLTSRADGYGYTCRRDSSGYVQASTPLSLSGDDRFAPVELPFEFPFYGQSHRTAYVSTNGMLSFGTGSSSFGNGAIPSTSTPNGAIYPYWDDLNVGTGGMLTDTIGAAPNRSFVIEWRDVYLSSGSQLRFEVFLHESGDVTFHYAQVGASPVGSSATVGIEDHAGAVALAYSVNEASIQNGDSIRFVDRSARVTGRVTDSDGAPIARARVEAAGGVTRGTSSSADGHYNLRLPAGSYELSSQAFGFVRAGAAINVAADSTTTRNIVLRDAPSHRLSGVVRDPTGEPLSGARVGLAGTPLEALTNAAGGYQFPRVPAGTYDVRGEAGRCTNLVTASVIVDRDRTRDLSLERRRDAYNHTCRFEDSPYLEADNPLSTYGDNSTATVELPFEFPLYGQTHRTAYISTNGFVSFTPHGWNYGNVPLPSSGVPNAAIYALWDDLYVPSGGLRTETIGTAPNRSFVVEWRGARTYYGTEPLTFEIVLRENGDFVIRYAELGTAGVGGLGATIGLEDENGGLAFQYSYNENSLREGEAIRFVNGTGRLTGTVREGGGDPVEGVRVEAIGAVTRNVTTGSDGRYAFRLPAGRFDLSTSAFGFEPQTGSRVVQVGAAATGDLSIVKRPAHPLSGVIRDGSGAPLARARVALLNTPLTALTNANGAYSFPSVPIGSYELRGETGGCTAPATVPVQVDSRRSLDLTLEKRTDGFAYSCRLDDVPFIEAGNVLPLSGNDGTASVALPFEFPFYGESHASVNVSTNGFLTFGSPSSYSYNGSIPYTGTPNAAIYALWDDLYVNSGGIRTETLGTAPNRSFVVEWRDAHFGSNSAQPVRFEIVLHEGGDIVLRYANGSGSALEQGSSATVGIEDHSGSTALAFSVDRAALRGGDGIRFVRRAGVMSGIVRDESGAPLQDVRVRMTGPLQRTVTTGSDGRYLFRLPAAAYELNVEAFAFNPSSSTQQLGAGESVTRDITLVRKPAHRLSGTVASTGSGAGVRIALLNTPLETRTDAHGSYEFPSVPDGTYEVRADAGRCSSVQISSVTIDSDETLDLAVEARTDAFGHTCRLDDAAYVSAETPLLLYGDDGSTAVTLPFEFPFYGQTHGTAYVSTNGFVSFTAPSSSFSNGGLPSLYAPNGAIYALWEDLYVYSNGVRTQTIGSAPNRAFVIEWSDTRRLGSSERLRFEIVLHEDGDVVVNYADLGTEGVSAWATAGIENQTGTDALAYSPTGVAFEDGFAIRYLSRTGRVTGTVLDRDGAPVPGARVTIDGAVMKSVTTGTSGAYSVSAPDGTYDVTAEAPGHQRRTQRVTIASREVVSNFVLAPAELTITGRVLDAESGAPIAQVWVRAVDQHGRTTTQDTDRKGSYSMTVPVGTYEIDILSRRFAPHTTRVAAYEDATLPTSFRLKRCDVQGSGGPDRLVGTEGADVICGRGGADVIRGGFGADLIFAGDGNDEVRGERNNDRLFGGLGDDFLYGGEGADNLYGGLGSDLLVGAEGSDFCDPGWIGANRGCEKVRAPKPKPPDLGTGAGGRGS